MTLAGGPGERAGGARTLIVSRGGERLHAIRLGDRPVRIGRDPTLDVVLGGPRISRRHATLDASGGTVRLDPQGRHPVLLNGSPLAGPAAIEPGDLVTIGPYELRLATAEELVEATPGPTPTPDPPTELIALDRAGRRLVVQRPVLVGPEGRRFPIARRLLRIGKGPDNDLVVADPYASVVHCVISQQGSRFFVRDLHSTNGTWVDDRQVVEAELAPGCTLVVGRTRLAFESETLGPLAVEPAPETECHDMLGRSAAMRRLFALVRRVAPTGATVLITGETGTGKELVARALHALSPRRGSPFVAVNCGALAPEVVESELFGHEKGAFTGAVGRRAGAFEAAHGGTLLLDEIAELPPSLQPKILRVLESRSVTRVGSSAEVPVDVRVVAATHRDLEDEVRAGRFREDLFYRLHVLPLEVPPLRERLEDLPMLAGRLLAGIGSPGDRLELGPGAKDRLAAHDWPGNVRELRNVLQRAALLAGGGRIEAGHVQFARLGRVGAPGGGGAGQASVPARRMEAVEREAILAALESTGWNKRAAARELGIAKSTLHEKIRKWNLPRRPAS